jgi:release factor glutamine methyltransferase
VAPSVDDLLASGEARLKRSPAIDHWPGGRERDEAERLLAFCIDREADDLDPDEPIHGGAARRFGNLIRRRAGGEPMAHILGWTEFRGLRLRVRAGAFVPRQSTEFLAEQALRRLRGRRAPVAIDLATGIGPVALAVAHGARQSRVHGSDVSPDAVKQARANARRLGLANAEFHTGDLFAALPRGLRGKADAITLHPPYVPRGEVRDLPLEVRGFEPESTLTDYSRHGLGLAERAATEGREWLRPGGWLLLEVSPDRARGVRALLVRSGYRDVRSTKGWPEVTRVLVGRA